MATRMQQRRGTATQWTTADPILAPGEIGFESDTNQFKIGDGINHWSDLSYFKNLEDLGGSLDDYILLSLKGNPNGVAELDADGKIPSSQIPSLVGLDSEITTAVNNAVTSLVDSAPGALNTLNELAAALNDDANFSATITNEIATVATGLSSHSIDISTHGVTGNIVGTQSAQTLTNKTISGSSNTISNIGNTSLTNSSVTINGVEVSLGEGHSFGTDAVSEGSNNLYFTNERAQDAVGNAVANGLIYDDSTGAIGPNLALSGGLYIDGAGKLAVDAYYIVDKESTQELKNKTIDTTYNAITVVAADISDVTATAAEINLLDGATLSTVELNYVDGVTSSIQDQLDSKASSTTVSDHTSDTTTVHGISDTANLVYTADLSAHTSDTTSVHGISDTANLVYTADLSAHASDTTNVHGIVDTSLLITVDDLSAHTSDTTGVHGISDTANLVYTSDLSLHASDTTGVHGISDTANLVYTSDLSSHASDTTSIHGITDTAELATKAFTAALLTGATLTNISITGDKDGLIITAENGVADATTTNLAEGSNLYFTDERAQDAVGNSVGTGLSYDDATGVVSVDTTAIQAKVALVSDTEIGYLNGVTSSIQDQLADKSAVGHGHTSAEITDFTEAVQDALGIVVGTGLSYDDATGAISVNTTTIQARVADVSDTEIGYLSNVTSGIQEQLDLKASLNSPTFTGTVTLPANTISQSMMSDDSVGTNEIGGLAVTNEKLAGSIGWDKLAISLTVSSTEAGYLDGVTSSIQDQLDGKQPIISGVSDTELGYLDGVTSSIQTQLNSKLSTSTASSTYAPLTGATFTGDVTVETDLIVDGNLTVSGTTTTISTANFTTEDSLIYLGEGNSANLLDLGFVSSFNDGTYQHAGLVRDASAGTWKLFKGVTDEPTTTVNFAQGSLDDLAVGAITATSASIGDVSNTELQYLNGVTSGVQTQLNAKTPELYTFVSTTGTAKTIATADAFKSLKFTDSGAITVTIPTHASDAIPVGTYVELYQWGGQITVVAATPATTSIRSTDSQTKSRTTYSAMVLIKVDNDEWLLTGDLTA